LHCDIPSTPVRHIYVHANDAAVAPAVTFRFNSDLPSDIAHPADYGRSRVVHSRPGAFMRRHRGLQRFPSQRLIAQTLKHVASHGISNASRAHLTMVAGPETFSRKGESVCETASGSPAIRTEVLRSYYSGIARGRRGRMCLNQTDSRRVNERKVELSRAAELFGERGI
jgi:hypothetical protein